MILGSPPIHVGVMNDSCDCFGTPPYDILLYGSTDTGNLYYHTVESTVTLCISEPHPRSMVLFNVFASIDSPGCEQHDQVQEVVFCRMPP